MCRRGRILRYAGKNDRWGAKFCREPCAGDDAYCVNLYAIAHAKGIYTNQKKTNEDKRVLNLTISGYASIQKYGTVLWSGDICATRDTFKKQITEGINMGISGMPYWTFDIGGFFVVNENWRHRGCGGHHDPSIKWFWKGIMMRERTRREISGISADRGRCFMKR